MSLENAALSPFWSGGQTRRDKSSARHDGTSNRQTRRWLDEAHRPFRRTRRGGSRGRIRHRQRAVPGGERVGSLGTRGGPRDRRRARADPRDPGRVVGAGSAGHPRHACRRDAPRVTRARSRRQLARSARRNPAGRGGRIDSAGAFASGAQTPKAFDRFLTAVGARSQLSQPPSADRLPLRSTGWASPLRALGGGLAVSGHEQPEPLLGGGRRVERRDDPAFEHHRNAIRERADLVKLARDEQDPRALAALLEEPLVDVFGRRDVETAGRLGDHDELGPLGELASEHDLLLIAAREIADDGLRAGGTDVVLRGKASTVPEDRDGIEHARAGVWGTVLLAEDEIVGDAEREDEALEVPVLRHVRDPPRASALGVVLGDVDPADLN